MKYLAILFLFTVIISGCASQAQIDKWKAEDEAKSGATNYNPCSDPRFIALRQKPIDSLSMREYDFVRQMEDKCSKYTEQQNSTSPGVTAVIVTVAVVATLYLIGRASSIFH